VTNKNLVIFSHGKESGPWGSKIRHLADIAQRLGAKVLSPDYSDLKSPDERVKRLLNLKLPPHDQLLLVGSSMGGYVSVVASNHFNPVGLFLMAPALYLPGYEQQDPIPSAGNICIVHGWGDDIVPVENSFSFAKKNLADLHVLDSDHRLDGVLPEVGLIFEQFCMRTHDTARLV
jgi:hypothetical protein